MNSSNLSSNLTLKTKMLYCYSCNIIALLLLYRTLINGTHLIQLKTLNLMILMIINNNIYILHITYFYVDYAFNRK